jgi:hypothetical protein
MFGIVYSIMIVLPAALVEGKHNGCPVMAKEYAFFSTKKD